MSASYSKHQRVLHGGNEANFIPCMTPPQPHACQSGALPVELIRQTVLPYTTELISLIRTNTAWSSVHSAHQGLQ